MTMKKKEIQIFNNEEFGEVRVMGTPDNPLFCATDVAKALGYANPAKAVIDHCKGVSILETPTPGGKQKMKYIGEAEVYRLILKSNAPRAEAFQDWVCGEVLPSIRKTGGYVSDAALDRVKTQLLATEETLEGIPLYTLGDLRMDVGMDEDILRKTLIGVYLIEKVNGRYEPSRCWADWSWNLRGLMTHRNKLVRKHGKDKLESELVFTDRGRLVVRVIVERMRDLYAELDEMTKGFERGEFPPIPMPREEKFVRKMKEEENADKKLVVVNN